MTTRLVPRVLGGLLLAVTLVTQPAAGQERARWSDTHTSRVEVLALMQTLHAELLASRSATDVLERWCGEHGLASPPRIVAEKIETDARAPSAEQLERLGVTKSSDVRHRRVALRCGTHVLSIADNWYVPSRLTAEMNRELDTTDTPFGKAVRPLQPYRRTVDAAMLWSPLPSGWQRKPRAASRWSRRREFVIPQELFRHRAVLYTSDHVPFSEVVETYQGAVMRFERSR